MFKNFSVLFYEYAIFPLENSARGEAHNRNKEPT